MRNKASQSSLFTLLIVTILALAILFPRLADLDRFVTVDESAWLIHSSNFYYALGQRDFEKTFYFYHPAVTTMWIITAGMLSYFPEYRGLGQGYIEKFHVYDQIFASFNKNPIELLKRSRLISVLINTLLLIFSFWLLRYLFGAFTAVFLTLLVALDPYFLGHSRLLNHEGMMSLFVLCSTLSAMIYFEKSQNWAFLLISAVSAGLALLTKSSSLVIVPFFCLMLAVNFFERRQPRSILGYLKVFLIWMGAVCLTFFLLWPGMWVNPGKMLYEVFGNALSYTFQGARISVVGEVNPAQFGLEPSGVKVYLNYLLWGTTPVVWLGCLLAFLCLWIKDKEVFDPLAKKAVLYFGLMAVLFILLFSFARGRNAPHYILTSYVFFDLVAGLGFIGGMRWLRGKLKFFDSKAASGAALLIILVLQGAGAIPEYPYYYTYSNPVYDIFRDHNPNGGYGEGLEQAGKYLSQKPDAKDLTVMSWLGYGPFSYYFPGAVNPLPPMDQIDPPTVEKLRQSDYLVVYDIVQKVEHRPAKLMDALAGIPSETMIEIKGEDYISIYPVSDLPDAFFEALR
jgi:4-amino-4-deoxy-L-arabinose transferase-like glycosyltransferase